MPALGSASEEDGGMTASGILFLGDSVTDCGRLDSPDGLGSGYPHLLAARPTLAGREVVNRGVSGARVRDTRAAVEADARTIDGGLVSLLIGVNDVWRGFDQNDPTPISDYERDLRAVMGYVRDRGFGLVLVEPFIAPGPVPTPAWNAPLDAEVAVVRQAAGDFGAVLVAARDAFVAAPNAAELTMDGVHPTPTGHEFLADLWLATVTEAGLLDR